MPVAKQKRKQKPAANKVAKAVIVTKSKIKAKDTLFGDKVTAMNRLLSKAKMMTS